MVFIYRQEILKDISLFTSQPKAKFYNELFINLDLCCIPAYNFKTGRTGYSNHSMICAFIVMKCEGFSQISDLHDYLSNNLIIAHYCGFDISRELPSYAKFTRFIREFDNDILQTASNQHNEKKYEFYWGYKNHILVNCISGLPICEFR